MSVDEIRGVIGKWVEAANRALLKRLGVVAGITIAIIPIVLSKEIGLQLQFGGTSVLIVVGVLLDTLAQIEQHRTLRKYDGFMKTGRVKFRGRQQRFM